jgi:hypothetical protein
MEGRRKFERGVVEPVLPRTGEHSVDVFARMHSVPMFARYRLEGADLERHSERAP